LLSSQSAKTILQIVDTTLQATRQSESKSNFENDLADTMSSLDETERARLDEIVDELIRRAVKRAISRLSSIERIG
jgi:FixJ family two-component response regulator